MSYNPATDGPALRAELVGNQGHYTLWDMRATLAKLNDPAQARTARDSSARTFSGNDLLNAITAQPGEYNTVVDGAVTQTAQIPARKLFVQHMISHGDEVIPTRFHAGILAIFSNAGAPTIRAAMIDEATGPMSMAEQLFGDDVVLAAADVNEALGPPTYQMMTAAERAVWADQVDADRLAWNNNLSPDQQHLVRPPLTQEQRDKPRAVPGALPTWS